MSSGTCGVLASRHRDNHDGQAVVARLALVSRLALASRLALLSRLALVSRFARPGPLAHLWTGGAAGRLDARSLR